MARAAGGEDEAAPTSTYVLERGISMLLSQHMSSRSSYKRTIPTHFHTSVGTDVLLTSGNFHTSARSEITARLLLTLEANQAVGVFSPPKRVSEVIHFMPDSLFKELEHDIFTNVS